MFPILKYLSFTNPFELSSCLFPSAPHHSLYSTPLAPFKTSTCSRCGREINGMSFLFVVALKICSAAPFWSRPVRMMIMTTLPLPLLLLLTNRLLRLWMNGAPPQFTVCRSKLAWWAWIYQRNWTTCSGGTGTWRRRSPSAKFEPNCKS